MKKKSVKTNQPSANSSSSSGNGYKIGSAIKADSVRVIGQDGENLGVMSLDQAISAAYELELDLVQIGGSAEDGTVTAKIMDVGKFMYEKKKQHGEAKKKQKLVEVKELKFRPNIGDGDYAFKIKRALEFLEEGKHVKITLQFRGREIAVKDTMGTKLFERIVKDVDDSFGQNYDLQKESKGGPFWSKIIVPKLK